MRAHQGGGRNRQQCSQTSENAEMISCVRCVARRYHDDPSHHCVNAEIDKADDGTNKKVCDHIDWSLAIRLTTARFRIATASFRPAQSAMSSARHCPGRDALIQTPSLLR